MSEQQASEADTPESQDSKADARAVTIVFCAAILMAMHFVSGFTFDF
jgi:hypothetical protein